MNTHTAQRNYQISRDRQNGACGAAQMQFGEVANTDVGKLFVRAPAVNSTWSPWTCTEAVGIQKSTSFTWTPLRAVMLGPTAELSAVREGPPPVAKDDPKFRYG